MSIGAHARSIGIYLSGVLFACGFWFFIDAAVYSKVANAGTVHITFVDWIPVICSSLGMLIVNSIDKSKLTSDNYGESSIAWKAKLILFIGFALLAGGLSGGLVRKAESRQLDSIRLFFSGRLDPQIHCTRLPFPDPLLWSRKRPLQRADYAILRDSLDISE